MSKFEPKKLNLNNINGGEHLLNEVDTVDAEHINALIEGVAYAQQQNETATTEIGKVAKNVETLSENLETYKENVQNDFSDVYFEIENVDNLLSGEVSDLSINVDDNTAEIGRINAILSNFADKDILAVAEGVENNQVIRETGGVELSLVEIKQNSKSVVTKIQGNSQVVDFGTENYQFANSKISGVRSIGKNLFPLPRLAQGYTQNGLTYTFDKGVVRIKGTAIEAKRNTFVLSGTDGSWGKIFTFFPKGKYTISGSINGSYQTHRIACFLSNEQNTLDLYNQSGVNSYTASQDYNLITMTVEVLTTANQVVDVEFKPMLTYGEEQVPFEEQVESQMTLPKTIELSKFDYIENGKLFKYGKMLTFNGSESWQYQGKQAMFVLPSDFETNSNYLQNYSQIQGYEFEITKEEVDGKTKSVIKVISTYEDYDISNLPDVLPSSNFIVLYKSSSPIVTDIEFDNKYQVYDKGYEIMQLESFYNEFADETIAVVPTITNDYLIVVRGNK